VRVSDYGVTADGLTYYVMEYLQGEDLGSILEREKTIPPLRAIHFAAQTCGALHEAHALGVTHRDIKPANLFVTCLGGITDFIKVLDFGVATWKGAAKITIAAPWIGTPAYISPEVVSGGEADARSDIYSLGGVLYHMLSGRRPFPYENVAALLLAQVKEPAPALSEVVGQHTSPVLEAIVMKCLEKDPNDRYQSAAELAFALNRYARGAFWTTAEHVRVVTTLA
jgi:serine/threonine-protein kinase